jgi:iron-sulfur cluster insertion protein
LQHVASGGRVKRLARDRRDRYNRPIYVSRGKMRGTAEIEETSRMINVTPSAASKISELLVEENKTNAGLRVFVQGGGCSGFQYGLMIDEGEGDATTDAVIESNGVKLLVDPISARYLRGAEVDFVDNITGGGFTIKNPNAKSTCGCGSSFSV